MIDTIIVSGGNIHSDFALDFLQKNKKENETVVRRYETTGRIGAGAFK